MLLCSTFDHCRLSVGRIGAAHGQGSLAPRSGRTGRRWPLRRIACTVNGVRREAEVEPRLLLVYFLRENLGLTGTNVGCDTSSCGACTVMMDGQSVKACTVLAVQADGAEITTIEGLASNGQLHPLQEAFRNNHGLQCGFCTPGMIMAGLGLIESGAGMERGGGPPGPRGQPLPLHRLPEHRQGHPGSGRRDAPGRPRRRPGRVRMTQVAEPGPCAGSAAAWSARRTPS